MTDFNKLAKDIVQNIGGRENISSLTHCATRLRFKLNDDEKADKDTIANLDGVINVVKSGGQFQVIIGNEVSQAFDAVQNETGVIGQSVDIVEKDDLKVRGKLIDRVVDLVTSIFVPILPVLIGGGMVRALLMIGTTFFGLSDTSGIYIIVKQLIDAGADCIDFPAPGSRHGISISHIQELIQFVHTYKPGTLAMSFLNSSLEGADTETVRLIALKMKETGADIHAIGDGGFAGCSSPENVHQLSISIKGKPYTYFRMASVNK